MTIKKKPFAKTKKDVQLVKDLLYPLLRNEVLEVEFRKVDGKTRKIVCTRNWENTRVKIPSINFVYTTNHNSLHHKNPDVCKVWDINKQSWRSFRFDAVISVAVV